METIKNSVVELNKLLVVSQFQIECFKSFINILKEHNVKLKILDFTRFDKKKQKEACTNKIEAVKNQEFEIAANYRDLEKKCMEIEEFKTQYNIVKSTFRYEKGYVLYFYLNTERNDKHIKELWNKFESL